MISSLEACQTDDMQDQIFEIDTSPSPSKDHPEEITTEEEKRMRRLIRNREAARR